VRRLALLFAGGAVWLILAALPVLADGGPHVMTTNNGSLGLNADGCAGCHRAHTATGPFLINAADETALCKTCHGAAVAGATTDVMTGIQYQLAGTLRGGTQLGALRAGGFDQARMGSDNASRLAYYRTGPTGTPPNAISFFSKVPVGGASDVSSAHIAMSENGLTNPGTMWGNGLAGSGAGPTVELSCVACHNPHGNGQYRILRPMPHIGDTDYAWTVAILSSTAADNRIYTKTTHQLFVGDTVTIAGHSSTEVNGSWTVASVTNAAGGAYVTLTGLNVLTDGTGGTITRTSGVKVQDAPLPGVGDARNYTVLQVRGTEGNNGTYLLYASQVVAAATAGTFNGVPGDYTAAGGDYFHRAVPWNPVLTTSCDPLVGGSCSAANDAPNGLQATFNTQLTAWCTTCHTRYFSDRNHTGTGTTMDSSWRTPRPDDNLFKFQHRTIANRVCSTCHVAHGSNAEMTGTFSSTFTYPDGTVSASSRLLKVDNRGTCQLCHDPTETVLPGTYIGPPAPTVP
jgi:predicted CXXCH cytochrome family protein